MNCEANAFPNFKKCENKATKIRNIAEIPCHICEQCDAFISKSTGDYEKALYLDSITNPPTGIEL